MSNLSDRMRSSREFNRDVGGWSLKLRRPLYGDLIAAYRKHEDAIEAEFSIVCSHTVDWSGVKESDLIKGASSLEVQFDPDAWREILLSDRDLWQEIRLILDEEYKRYEEAQAAKAKK